MEPPKWLRVGRSWYWDTLPTYLHVDLYALHPGWISGMESRPTAAIILRQVTVELAPTKCIRELISLDTKSSVDGSVTGINGPVLGLNGLSTEDTPSRKR